MVEQSQFKILVKAMKAVYTKPDFIPDKNAFDVWYAMLKDLDYAVMEKAIQSIMMTSPYPPTIADIRKAAVKMSPAETELVMPEMEAWARVKKAIRNSIYNADEEYEKLPPLIQKTVGNPTSLTMWAQMDSETLNSVEQSHFLRSYRAIVSRERELKTVSPAIRQLIAGQEKPKLPDYMPIPDFD